MKVRIFLLALIPTINKAIQASPNDNKANLRTVSWYRQRPHDTALYDILNVRYDASPGEIAKSYRKLSLEWHPDKTRRRKLEEQRKRKAEGANGVPPPPPLPPSDDKAADIEEYAREKLEKLRFSYDVLCNDETRLLYHRYGIRDGIEGAIQLLTGLQSPSNSIDSDEQMKLLQLMGHPPHLAHDAKEARILYLTSTIVEKLRPLVEDTVSQDMYVQSIYDECITLSKSALGKQILRCVGRAYKREGYRVLRTMNKSKGFDRSHVLAQTTHQHKISDAIRDTCSNIRHLASAAIASSKLILVETKLKRLQLEREKRKSKTTENKIIVSRLKISDVRGENLKRDHLLDDTFIENIGVLPDESDDESSDEIGSMFSDDEADAPELDDAHFEHLANEKTYTALLTAHQTEVLWKLTKMDLDSTIREACRRMLVPVSGNRGGGWYSFLPSENSPYPQDWSYSSNHQPDGWVGRDGDVVHIEVGRLRAAAALVLVGGILVRCGKGIE